MKMENVRKMEFQKILSSPHRKNRSEQEQKKNVEKRELREMDNQKETNEGTTKNDPSCIDKNDPWSDHPETQFGPIYPFFQNHKP